MKFDIDSILAIAVEAGARILDIYRILLMWTINQITRQLHKADQAAHAYIVHALQQHTPHIPVYLKSQMEKLQAQALHLEQFWLVDPLDGTREFIQRNDEFTVNIALIQNQKTVWGCIYAPVFKKLWWGGATYGAFTQYKQDPVRSIAVLAAPQAHEKVHILVSRNHQMAETQASWLQEFSDYEFHPRGSSLKFCDIAEGLAHVYLRLGPTCEWDTGAGQAIVEGAGGSVRMLDGSVLRYQKNQEKIQLLLSVVVKIGLKFDALCQRF